MDKQLLAQQPSDHSDEKQANKKEKIFNIDLMKEIEKVVKAKAEKHSHQVAN